MSINQPPFELSSSPPSLQRRDEQDADAESQLYILEHGHVYASRSINMTNRTRLYASINLTTDYKPFHLRVGKDDFYCNAAAVPPGRQRTMEARDVRTLSFQLIPHHPLFPRFRHIGSSWCMSLPRKAFAHLDEQLCQTFEGTLDAEAVARLHDDVVAVAAGFLPAIKPIDPRIQQILELLDDNETPPLSELSHKVGLSYHRLSHLFAESMGISLRTYYLWLKVARIRTLFDRTKSFTELAQEAGFTDSAHLTRTCQDMFGASPSYFLRNKAVRLHTSKRVRPCSDPSTPLSTVSEKGEQPQPTAG